MTTETYQRKENHYVDKEKFYHALADYQESARQAVAAGKEKPRVPEYIGDCFLKIATGLSRKHNFVGYSFRDEMISVGVLKCLENVEKFDPKKSTQAFSYFTQTCFYEFVHVILSERNQKKKKVAYIQNMDLEQLVDTSDPEQGQQMLDYIRSMLDEDAVSNEKAEKKKAAKKKGLEGLMQDQNS